MSSLDESTCSLPATSTNAPKRDVRCQFRIEKILLMPCNQTCADCGAPDPEWASLLLSGKDNVEGLGVVVCQQCAVHHVYELGENRAFVKFLMYSHEWTHPELDLLEFCGNDLINEAYEALLTSEDFQEKDEEEQAKFIKNKYKKGRYMDPEALERATELVALRAERAKFTQRRKRSMDMMGKSKRGSMDVSFQATLKKDDDTGSVRSLCSSGRSLCSELDGSDVYSLCDAIDNEDSYLDCEKFTYQACRSNFSTNYTWDGSEREVPARSVSNPVAMAKAVQAINPHRLSQKSDAIPARPTRRISNDSGPCVLSSVPLSKNNNPMLFRRMSSPLADEVEPEAAKVVPHAA